MKRIITVLCILSAPVMAVDVMHQNKQDDNFSRMRKSIPLSVSGEREVESVDPYEQVKMSDVLRGRGEYTKAAELLWSALLNKDFIDRITRDILRADAKKEGEDLDELLVAADGKQKFVKIYTKKAETGRSNIQKRLAAKKAAKQ